MSKIGEICAILEAGGHVMGNEPLRSYHAARAIRDGLRAHDFFSRARQAAKNYRVRVEYAPVDSGKKLTISTFNRSHEISV